MPSTGGHSPPTHGFPVCLLQSELCPHPPVLLEQGRESCLVLLAPSEPRQHPCKPTRHPRHGVVGAPPILQPPVCPCGRTEPWKSLKGYLTPRAAWAGAVVSGRVFIETSKPCRPGSLLFFFSLEWSGQEFTWSCAPRQGIFTFAKWYCLVYWCQKAQLKLPC